MKTKPTKRFGSSMFNQIGITRCSNLARFLSGLLLVATGLSLTLRGAIIEISIPEQSQCSYSRPSYDNVWRVASPPYPLNVTSGIGIIINPTFLSYWEPADAALHQNDGAQPSPLYAEAYVPASNSVTVTYRFDRPQIVKGLEVIQHVNGVTRVEGFLGSSTGSVASLGSVFGPAGDVTEAFVVPEDGVSQIFDFGNTNISGTVFQFIVRKTCCSLAFAIHRAYPLDAAGRRIGLPLTLYVSLESSNPVPPFATWATAATNIQDAVDAARSGDTVLVTNGVYAVGGRSTTNEDGHVSGNRVFITNAIRLESVNGPLVTIVQGAQEGENGQGAMRCVYLGTNAVLSGFTLTNGVAANGGGVICEYESGGVVTNCTLTGNSAKSRGGGGGGAYGGRLYNCTLIGNIGTDSSGKGAFGGAASKSTLHNCTLIGNSADGGGGAASSTLHNCTLTGNSAGGGGGAWMSTLYNCTLTGNSAGYGGGGANECTLYNCTITGNDGGGVGDSEMGSSTVFNSIIYGNTNGNYTEGTILNYCLTTPLPTNGIGNIAADPGFVNAAAGNFHLRPNSPCVDAGTNLLSLITTDFDGEYRPWDGNRDGVAAFDIGAYEFRPSPVTLYVSLENPNPVPPYATWATAATNIQDAVDAAHAGDTVLVTNGVYAVGEREVLVWSTWWEPPQFYNIGLSRVVVTNAIRLESVNGPLVTTIDGGGSVRCMYLGTNAVLSGFTLTNGFVATSGGGRGGGVFSAPSGVVTNCTLAGNSVKSRGGGGGGAYGGTLYNCTLNGNIANDPTWTKGNSGGAASKSTLHNCTLIGNSADFAGGADSCTLHNCTLTGNSAYYGGGASSSMLYNCILTSNSAAEGGGASTSTLYNCTVTGNDGGGVRAWQDPENRSKVYNSIVYYNFGGNHDEYTTLNFSSTSPLPTNGVGNITGHPLFMDMEAGDFRLREESPCIDAGTNLMGFPIMRRDWEWNWVIVGHITDPTDILGNTRFIDGNFDGTVAWDMGAYEFNSFPPPQFTCAPQRMPDCWRLSITGAPNKWVHVQKSTDLKNWEDCWSGWMGAAGIKQVDDADLSQKAMFYRAVVE